MLVFLPASVCPQHVVTGPHMVWPSLPQSVFVGGTHAPRPHFSVAKLRRIEPRGITAEVVKGLRPDAAKAASKRMQVRTCSDLCAEGGAPRQDASDDPTRSPHPGADSEDEVRRAARAPGGGVDLQRARRHRAGRRRSDGRPACGAGYRGGRTAAVARVDGAARLRLAEGARGRRALERAIATTPEGQAAARARQPGRGRTGITSRAARGEEAHVDSSREHAEVGRRR